MDHAPKRACQAPVEGSASVPGRRRDSTAAYRDSIPVSSISGVGRRARTAAPKKWSLREIRYGSLRWYRRSGRLIRDVTDGDGAVVTVRRSKTNQEGETRDVRFVKDGVLRAIRTLWAATSLEPDDRVVPWCTTRDLGQ